MTAFDALRAAYTSGVVITAEADRLILRGRGQLPARVRAALAADKPAILALLAEQGIGQHDDYGSPEPRRYAVPPGCIARGACHRLGPCDAFLTGTPPCGLATRREEAA